MLYGRKKEYGMSLFKLKEITQLLLKTNDTVPAYKVNDVGLAHTVDQNSFPALDGVTCYTLELWEECMRIPHWHPNASELGYVVSGSIEIIIWRSPGETARFTLTTGQCWFIPQAALHSLNNIGKEHAKLFVGFSASVPQDIDLPVAFNGIPIEIRQTYTNPHSELRKWLGIVANPLVGRFHLQPELSNVLTASPYGFDLAAVPPLLNDTELGSVVWGVKSNWNILQNISVLRARLKPGVARDAIWYPDAGTLYVVARGKAEFHIVIANIKPTPFTVGVNDYIFVPAGVLHCFLNKSTEDFEVIAFFTQANPAPEVSLLVSSSFFPDGLLRSAMTTYADQHKTDDPLKDLQKKSVSPFLVKIQK
jgi:oxalate decarboxylase/phosphoglucose isomerase-like protein (cupin superfamily)